MRNFQIALWFFLALLPLSSLAASQSSPATAPGSLDQITNIDQVIDKIFAREHLFNAKMRHFHPLVETYIQNLSNESQDAVPVNDHYFLGRFEMSDAIDDHSFLPPIDFKHRALSVLTSIYELKFLASGFAQMAVLDSDFQRKYYDVTFLRQELLAGMHCLVFDVQPKKRSGSTRFMGAIWVEDQGYNIVRFKGIYTPQPKDNYHHYLRFDSWRVNTRPDLWLPAYIGSEGSQPLSLAGRPVHFRAQTRLWGYDLHLPMHIGERTGIMFDSSRVQDESEDPPEAVPVDAARGWKAEAEDRALDRLQAMGLTAPEGQIDKDLQTIADSLVAANHLDIQPPVRVRVMLTQPLESFTIGHAIVLSRGLLDVLPDDGPLALIVARELGNIALGHSLETKVAFNDRIFFPDEEMFERLDSARNPSDEDAADKMAVDLLLNSPYKDRLASATAFLSGLRNNAPKLKSLIRLHIGNQANSEPSSRTSQDLDSAPQEKTPQTGQIAAMPFGGQIEMDPWSDRLTLNAVLSSGDQKSALSAMPFLPQVVNLSATKSSH